MFYSYVNLTSPDTNPLFCVADHLARGPIEHYEVFLAHVTILSFP